MNLPFSIRAKQLIADQRHLQQIMQTKELQEQHDYRLRYRDQQIRKSR